MRRRPCAGTLQFRLLLCDQGCDIQHAGIPAVLNSSKSYSKLDEVSKKSLRIPPKGCR